MPLFVGALVGSFAGSGALYRYDGRWALAPQQPEALPAAVSALLQSQIERLSDEARHGLDVLAVCGAQLDHALLERLVPAECLVRGLADLRAAGLVVEEVIDGRIRYGAGHPLICEVAYELLPIVVRRRHHAEVARAVQEYAPEQQGLLAQHVRRAGDEIDPGQAFDVLVSAADQALARKAGDEALADLHAALDLVDVVARRELRLGLLDRLAEAYELAGHLEQAVSAWCTAAAQRPDGIGRAERLHRAAVLELEAGRGEQCRHYLSQAGAELVDIEPAPAHLSLALTRLHMAYRSGSSAAADAAITEVQRLGNPGSTRVQMAVLAGRFHLALVAGRYAEGRVHLSALTALAAQLGDALGEQVLRPSLILELAWGDLRAARSMGQDALRLARRTGVPSLEMRPRVGLGFAAFFTGEWEEALQRSREVVDLAQRVVLPRGTALGMAVRGLVMLRRGRLDDAAACVAQARGALGHQSLIDRHVLGPIEAVEAR